VKRTIFLSIVLAGIWLLWSGHYRNPFLLLLGLTSVSMVVLLAGRMEITDDEGAPIGLGFRPIGYAVWLAKEIVRSNIEVTRLILDPNLPIHPRMIRVEANQKTELGRVILANSITLTPGTVSVDMQGNRIWVHALSFDDAEEDLSGDMDRRVSKLEV
jgi:multicomponent Na+:H+ antiporter subunit E